MRRPAPRAAVLQARAHEGRKHGLDRPSDVVFGSDDSMYIVDWGASTTTDEGLKLAPLTGAIGRVYKDGEQGFQPEGPLAVQAPHRYPRSCAAPR